MPTNNMKPALRRMTRNRCAAYIAEQVDKAIHEISVRLLESEGINSGDISPLRARELSRIKGELVACLNEWIEERRPYTEDEKYAISVGMP